MDILGEVAWAMLECLGEVLIEAVFVARYTAVAFQRATILSFPSDAVP